MNLIDAIQNRRSIRSFQKKGVDRSLIQELLEFAIMAPSASNKQAWRFFVVEKKEIIQQMSQSVQKEVNEISQHIDPIWQKAFQNYGEYFVRFQEAPVVIVPTYREIVTLSNMIGNRVTEVQEQSVQIMENNSGLISVSLAIENLLLYAPSIGLGASCMTGPLLAAPQLQQLLKIPQSWKIAALVPLGYPKENPNPTKRKALKHSIRWVE